MSIFGPGGELFTCDWPIDGVACGAPAVLFLEVDNVHRPLCRPCAIQAAKSVERELDFRPIAEVDPNRVPQKPSTQVEREAFKADEPKTDPKSRVVDEAQAQVPYDPREFRKFIGDDGEDDDMPPSRPTLQQALAELAVSVVLGARESIERWRKRR